MYQYIFCFFLLVVRRFPLTVRGIRRFIIRVVRISLYPAEEDFEPDPEKGNQIKSSCSRPEFGQVEVPELGSG